MARLVEKKEKLDQKLAAEEQAITDRKEQAKVELNNELQTKRAGFEQCQEQPKIDAKDALGQYSMYLPSSSILQGFPLIMSGSLSSKFPISAGKISIPFFE